MHATVIAGRENVDKARLLTLRQAAKLEVAGLRHSSGKSVIALIKREFGIKLKTKIAVYRAFYVYVEDVVFGNKNAEPDMDENGRRIRRERERR